MNDTPGCCYVAGDPPPTSRPTRLMFSVDPETRTLRAWNGQTWVKVVDVAQDVSVYVDATLGLDTNPGTSGRPVRTMARALALLPAVWTGSCRVRLAPGTYEWPDQISVGTPVAGGEPCLIQGSYAPWASGERTASGIATPAGTQGKYDLTDNSLALTVDAWAGWFLRFTSGACVGQRYIVLTNTTDTVTIAPGTMASPPLPGDTFVIEAPAVNFSLAALTGAASPYIYNVSLAFLGVNFLVTGRGLIFRDCNILGEGLVFTQSASRQVVLDRGYYRFGCLRRMTADRTWFHDLDQDTITAGGLALLSNAAVSPTFLCGGDTALGICVSREVALWTGTGSVWGATVLDLRLTRAGMAIDAETTGTALLGTPSIGPSIVACVGGIGIRSKRVSCQHLYNVEIRGAAVGVFATEHSYIQCWKVVGPAPLATAAFLADLHSRIALTSDCTLAGPAGTDLLVDGTLRGTHALHAASGIVGPTGAQIDRGSSTSRDPAAFVATGGTSEYQSFVARIASGTDTCVVTSHRVTAATFLRVTPKTQAAGKVIAAWAVAPDTITLTASSNAASDIDVLVEIIG